MGRGIRFTTEFKREAVRLVLTTGRPRAEIAEDLGVGLSSLTRWIGLDDRCGSGTDSGGSPQFRPLLEVERTWFSGGWRSACSGGLN